MAETASLATAVESSRFTTTRTIIAGSSNVSPDFFIFKNLKAGIFFK
jgi:hypothetical protein